MTKGTKVELNGRELYCPCVTGEGIKRTLKSFEEQGEVHLITTRALTLEMLRVSAKEFKGEVAQSKSNDEMAAQWAKEHFCCGSLHHSGETMSKRKVQEV